MTTSTHQLNALGVLDSGVYNVSASTLHRVSKTYVDEGDSLRDLQYAILAEPDRLSDVHGVGPRVETVLRLWATGRFDPLLDPSDVEPWPTTSEVLKEVYDDV